MKKRFISLGFWIWSLTWGCLMTIPGLIVSLIAILCGGTPRKNGCSYIIEIGGNWGGLELGPIALMGRYSKIDPGWAEHTRRHEFGHNLQHLIFGPLQIFIIWIPSIIRYWVIHFKQKQGKTVPDYDSIWFEYTATMWGTHFIDNWDK